MSWRLFCDQNDQHAPKLDLSTLKKNPWSPHSTQWYSLPLLVFPLSKSLSLSFTSLLFKFKQFLHEFTWLQYFNCNFFLCTDFICFKYICVFSPSQFCRNLVFFWQSIDVYVGLRSKIPKINDHVVVLIIKKSLLLTFYQKRMQKTLFCGFIYS